MKALFDIGATNSNYMGKPFYDKHREIFSEYKLPTPNTEVDLGGHLTTPVLACIEIPISISFEDQTIHHKVRFSIFDSTQEVILGFHTLLGPFKPITLAFYNHLGHLIALDAKSDTAKASRAYQSHSVGKLIESLHAQTIILRTSEADACETALSDLTSAVGGLQRIQQTIDNPKEHLASLLDKNLPTPSTGTANPPPDSEEDLIAGTIYKPFKWASGTDSSESEIIPPYDFLDPLSAEIAETMSLPDVLELYAVKSNLPFNKQLVERELQKTSERDAYIGPSKGRLPESWWQDRVITSKALQHAAYLKRKEEWIELRYDMLKDVPDHERAKWIEIINDPKTESAFTTEKHGHFEIPERSLKLKPGFSGVLKQRARNVPPPLREKTARTLQFYLDSHMFVKGHSNTLSPIVVVSKGEQNSMVRICGDYTLLNNYLEPVQTPIADVRDFTKFYLTYKDNEDFLFYEFDVRNAFHKIPLDEASRRLTALTTPAGVLIPEGLSEGIQCASAIFNQCLFSLVADLEWCFAIQDGLIFTAKSHDEGRERFRQLIDLCNDRGITLHVKKSKIAAKAVDFFGYKLGKDGWCVDDAKVETISKVQMPNTKSEMRSFLGAMNFAGPFIENFANLRAPLDNFTRKDFEVTPEAIESLRPAFETMKRAIQHAVKLQYPRYEDTRERFIIRTDASDIGCGAVLLQEMLNPHNADAPMKLRPIAFAHEKFSGAQLNWPTVKQEAYALVHGLKTFHHYIMDWPILAQVDHRNLLYLEKLNSEAILQRWACYISTFNIVVEHLPGAENQTADMFSRQLTLASLVETSRIPAYAKEIAEFCDISVHEAKQLCAPEWIGDWMIGPGTAECVGADSTEPMCRNSMPAGLPLSTLSAYNSQLFASNTRTRKGSKRGVTNQLQIAQAEAAARAGTADETHQVISQEEEGQEQFEVVEERQPESIEEAFKFIHEIQGLHVGYRRTHRLLQVRFPHIPISMRQVHHLVDSCPTCCKLREPLDKLRAKTDVIKVAHPFSCLTADLLTLPLDSEGNNYLLVLTNMFTKFRVLIPQKDKSAESFKRALLQYAAYFPLPSVLRTDAGSDYTSATVAEVCDALGLRHIVTIVGRPQASGAERGVGIAKELIMALCHDQSVAHEWSKPENLAPVAYVCNSFSEEHGMSPRALMFGSTAEIFSAFPDLMAEADQEYKSEFLQRLDKRLRDCRAKAHDAIIARQDKRARQGADLHTLYAAGDFVYVKRQSKWRAHKLMLNYSGPFEVVDQIGGIIHLRDPLEDDEFTAHVDTVAMAPVRDKDEACNILAKERREFRISEITAHEGTTRKISQLIFTVKFEDGESCVLPHRDVAKTEALALYVKKTPILHALLKSKEESRSWTDDKKSMTYPELAAKYDLPRAPSANPSYNTIVYLALEGMIGEDPEGLVIPSMEATKLPTSPGTTYYIPVYARKNNKRSLNIAICPSWTDRRFYHMDLSPETVQNYVRSADHLFSGAKVLSPMTYKEHVVPCLNIPTTGQLRLPTSALDLQSSIKSLPEAVVYSTTLEVQV